MPWYVLYTKPHNERKTAALLSAKGIEVYCPEQQVVKQWSDRKKKVMEPVFRSFLFVMMKQYHLDNVAILMTPGAVRFLWWMAKPAVVRDEEIEAIKAYLGRYTQVTVTDKNKWQPGVEVSINEGVFKGQKGMISSIKNNKAYLELPAFGWQLVAEIPLNSLSEL